MVQRFSIPLNTKLPEDFVIGTFIPFLNQYKKHIYDIYFTCRMPPFVQDAMGDTIDGDMRETTFNALYVSKETGIPLSATFNNIQVLPNQKNLDLFIQKTADPSAGTRNPCKISTWLQNGIDHLPTRRLQVKIFHKNLEILFKLWLK